MPRKCSIQTALLVLSTLYAFGCGGSVKTEIHAQKRAKSIQTAYIVDNGYSTIVGYPYEPLPDIGMIIEGKKSQTASLGDTANHIKRALQSHSVESTIGDNQSIPQNVDIVVRFEDEWQWDAKKYLRRLVIRFYDAKNGEKLVETTYHPKRMIIQTFPTPEKKVPGIIGSMIGQLSGS